ncbi:GxxExxY protein [Aquisphaera insulae]|uniref:GxxExxY protein n=1 Tax=Aquisphaera insulae TaxID=2712864 RepID=UPI0013EB1815|nr:GxxExxY protein [Aquisphaera insulae]
MDRIQLADESDWNRLTEAVIGAAFRVLNGMGTGFLEKIYENALAIELRDRGVPFEQQKPIPVLYKGIVVGDFVADLVIAGTVIVELKCTKEHHEVFEAQCLNYLKATGLPLCLLLNFGKPQLTIHRLRSPYFKDQTTI